MNYMNTINEIQALFTKLRREVQREEAPKVGKHETATDPAFPLNAKVAKVLGKAPYLHPHAFGKGVNKTAWCMYNDPEQDHPGNMILVPDYPNDLTAAMGALEEYCELTNSYTELTIHSGKTHGDKRYFCDINMREKPDPTNSDSGWMIGSGTSLPQAICETIVAHSEGK